MLNIVRHAIGLICPADKIPNTVEVDVSSLDINESIHINALTLPEGVKPVIRGRDFTVCSIVAPTSVIEEQRAAAAAAAAAACAGRGSCSGRRRRARCWRRSGCWRRACRRCQACRRRQAGCCAGQEVSRRRGRRFRHGYAASYRRPGQSWSQYARNRHNAGFIVVDMLHAEYGFGPWKAKFEGLLSEGALGGRKTYLLKPQTYMNLSGDSVGPALRFFKLPLERAGGGA